MRVLIIELGPEDLQQPQTAHFLQSLSSDPLALPAAIPVKSAALPPATLPPRIVPRILQVANQWLGFGVMFVGVLAGLLFLQRHSPQQSDTLPEPQEQQGATPSVPFPSLGKKGA